MREVPYTGAERKPFSWAKVGHYTVCLNAGGDITITSGGVMTGRHVLLLGNANEGSDDIPNLIDLLQRQMNCVRGV